MLRRSRQRLFSFDALATQGLFAGQQQQQQQHARAAAAARHWQHMAPDAPLPLPVVVPLVTSSVRRGAMEDAVAQLVVHPESLTLLRSVLQELSSDPTDATLPQLERLLELVRSSGAVGATEVLTAMSQLVRSAPNGESSDGHTDTNGMTCASDRARVRRALLRQIRFVPSTASDLLRPLCHVSEPVEHEVSDVMDTLRIATRGGHVVHPNDLAAVLRLVAASGNTRHVVSLWSWMQHTSVCWDVEAASAAMCALSAHGRLEDAVSCMQSLAEDDSDPTPAAQLAFLRLLARQRPTMPEYAKQLVRHWYPSPQLLWASTDVAMDVGVALLGLLHQSNDLDSVEEFVEEACTALRSQPPSRLFAFLEAPAVSAIVLSCAASLAARRVPSSADVAELLFHLPLKHVTTQPTPPASVLAGLALMGQELGATEAVCEAFAKLAVDAQTFAAVSRALAEAPLARGTTPAQRLQWITTLGHTTNHTVPDEVRLWLELVGSNIDA